MSSEYVLVITCVGVGGVALIVVVAIVSGQWVNLRRMQAETMLRQEMLAKGFSADDIISVETSAAERKEADQDTKFSQAAWNLATAVQAMAAAEHETAEIAAVIETFLQQRVNSSAAEMSAKDGSDKDGVRAVKSTQFAGPT